MASSDDRRREIDEEIESHLQARVDHLVAKGLSPETAREEAIRRFGGLEAGRARLVAQAVQLRRSHDWRHRLETISHDLRYVRRSLTRQPVFAAGVIATLALGLGINSALFRLADRVLFRPPDGVARPQDLRVLENASTQATTEAVLTSTYSYRDGRIATASGAFAQTSVNTPPRLLTLASGRQASVSYVDAAFFSTLGVSPFRGRFFDAQEGEAGAGLATVVVSFPFWQRELASAPLGASLVVTIGSKPYQVVGVTPTGFSGIDLDPAEIWLPMGVADFGHGYSNGVVTPWYRTEMMRGLRILGRVAAGTSDAVTTTRINSAFLAADEQQQRRIRSFSVRPLIPFGGAAVSEASRRLIGRLAGVAVIVLLIACANAMHLLLARGIRRQREIATRVALGASRARIWRLLMLESAVLGLAGGAAAALAGGWTATALQALILPDSRWRPATIDLRTFLFTGGLALVAGLAAGVAPAVQAASPDLVSAIKSGRGAGNRAARATRTVLLVAQTALSIVLLVASGLLVRSLVRLNAVDLGFDPRGLVTLSLSPVSITADLRASRQPPDALARRVRETEPGVEVALTSVAPFGAVRMTDTRVPGTSYTPPTDADNPRISQVGPNFFSVMRIPIRWGRAFDASDDTGEPVSIVNASMAQNYWGASLPPGACVLPVGSPCARVVGIVDDIRESPSGAPPPMLYYMPLDQDRGAPSVLVMRTTPAQAPALAARVKGIVPSDTRGTVEVTGDRVGRALRPWESATWLFVSLGAVALALACLGIYSIMSYGASERAHELGVRVALGATASDVMRLILGGGFRLVLLGSAIGLATAAAAGQLLASLLFQISAFDAAVYAGALVGICCAAALAMMPAAIRASRVDALVALREE